MAEARSDGLTIRYDDRGRGETALLCTSGWCASRHYYDELAPLLSRHYRVLALDWRGHGDSDLSRGDFGGGELVRDAVSVIESSGAPRVIPVAAAHSGWIAIELRRALGAERIPAVVLLDWIVTAAPPPFLAALSGLQDPQRTASVREQLFAMWTEGVKHRGVVDFVRNDMATAPLAMWSRAGREIAAAYGREGSPLAALARLSPPPRTLHVCAQPTDEGSLREQEEFARAHPWFHVLRLQALSHFPALEAPGLVADSIEGFVG